MVFYAGEMKVLPEDFLGSAETKSAATMKRGGPPSQERWVRDRIINSQRCVARRLVSGAPSPQL